MDSKIAKSDESAPHRPTVFISYKWESEEHSQWVEKLAGDLRRRGINALLDKWEVRLGESFSDYMTTAIARSDAFLFIITSKAVSAVEGASGSGGAVRFEVQLATARRIAGDKFRFIGILREGDRPPTHLRDARYADFRNDDRYAYELAMLVADLKGKSEKPELPPSLDFDLIAEPVIHQIWRGLPHGRWYLVEPAPMEVQTAISDGLVKLMKNEGRSRGYIFNALSAELDNCEPKHLRDFFYNVLPDISLPVFDLATLHDSPLPVTVLVRHKHDERQKHIRNSALVLMLHSTKRYSDDLNQLLYTLRACSEHLPDWMDRDNRISVVLMPSDVIFEEQSLGSPWWNIYEFVRL